MTIEDLIQMAGQADLRLLTALFAAPPILVLIANAFYRQKKSITPPGNYLYAFFVYLVCTPGVLSCVLTAYALFFTRRNLLTVNLFIYFFPILSMIVTLILVRKTVALDKLPGVDRLYALMILLAVSFAVALFIQKTRIWIFFGGSIGILIVLAVFCFALLKWSMAMLFRPKGEPKTKPPDFSNIRSNRRGKPVNAGSELKKIKKKLGIKN
ncbi:hypothetical protein ACFLZM_02435 [Thermodesulfobacteriota bacterium]